MKQISDQRAHEIQTRDRSRQPSQFSTIAHLESLTKAEQAKRLRLTLELVKQKQARNLHLSVAEEELLAECHRRYYSKEKETIKVDHNGSVHIEKSAFAKQRIKNDIDYRKFRVGH